MGNSQNKYSKYTIYDVDLNHIDLSDLPTSHKIYVVCRFYNHLNKQYTINTAQYLKSLLETATSNDNFKITKEEYMSPNPFNLKKLDVLVNDEFVYKYRLINERMSPFVYCGENSIGPFDKKNNIKSKSCLDFAFSNNIPLDIINLIMTKLFDTNRNVISINNLYDLLINISNIKYSYVADTSSSYVDCDNNIVSHSSFEKRSRKPSTITEIFKSTCEHKNNIAKNATENSIVELLQFLDTKSKNNSNVNHLIVASIIIGYDDLTILLLNTIELYLDNTVLDFLSTVPKYENTMCVKNNYSYRNCDMLKINRIQYLDVLSKASTEQNYLNNIVYEPLLSKILSENPKCLSNNFNSDYCCFNFVSTNLTTNLKDIIENPKYDKYKLTASLIRFILIQKINIKLSDSTCNRTFYNFVRNQLKSIPYEYDEQVDYFQELVTNKLL